MSETVTPVEAAEQLCAAILADLDAGLSDTTIMIRYGISLNELQSLCGRRGHWMETFDNGDGAWAQSYRCCVLCGMPDAPEDYEP